MRMMRFYSIFLFYLFSILLFIYFLFLIFYTNACRQSSLLFIMQNIEFSNIFEHFIHVVENHNIKYFEIGTF